MLIREKNLVNSFYAQMCKYKLARRHAVAILYTVDTKVVPDSRIINV